ncbi:MAG: transcription termination/antitermination factor NusG [Firmicutes bacterium]|jgi:transcriptional antiterminator NusG|nr:transcription termination/antitermination factor NusG [Bacillota bacterium]
MSEQEKHKWYVIHTYSGYENKVKTSIEKKVENQNMQDLISELIVPLEEVKEMSAKGELKTVTQKVYPCYVFVKMIMNDDTWYVVRNTNGVTSFVGPGSKPVPLTDDEVLRMGIESFSCNINPGDSIIIISGPFENASGIVKEVNPNKRKVVVTVDFLGRETPTELDFNQVKLME